MINTNYTVQVLQPSEGYTLTQSADVDVTSRILSKKVFLAVTDSIANWKEITDEEATEIRKQQQKRIEADEKAKQAE